jgi:hypothetical protein
MKYFWCILFLNFINFSFASDVSSYESNWVRIDPRSLTSYSEEKGPVLLAPHVGKRVVKNLLQANGKAATTTSCRLENKCITAVSDLQEVLADLKHQGYALEDREVKNLPQGAKAGTFTFYGTSVKFGESNHLPKTSIKMRIRAYIVDDGKSIKRSVGTDQTAFLEIKIKNPYPEYPLSVHKYRLMMPDEDILELINANPTKQKSFFRLMRKLANRAHERDKEHKEALLIDAMFEEIRIMAIAEPGFIKPLIGITYYRASKKYDETYNDRAEKKKTLRRTKNKIEPKTRSYEITIDESVKAFNVEFFNDDKKIDIEKYFTSKGYKKYLIASFPESSRIVEFKQPDSIGYDGPGRFRRPEKMTGPQKDLWQAFVGTLHEKALDGTKPDSGKYAHVKQFIRMRDNKTKAEDQTVLYRD